MKKFIYIHPTSSCGMCGYIWQVMRAMYHFPNEKYYIHLGYECMFYDKTIKYTENVWEYYFKQPHINEFPSKENIIKEVGLLQDEFSEFRDCYIKNPTKDLIYERRIKYHEIMRKNVILKESIQEKVDNIYKSYFEGKKVLGIHCRSTDHPNKINISSCIKMLRSLNVQYDVIFAASDDEHEINYLKNMFGKKLITNNSLRSLTGSALHHHENRRIVKDCEYNYKIGEDVIIETYLLSKTDFLFCTTDSNVNYLVKVMNPNLKYITINHETQV